MVFFRIVATLALLFGAFYAPWWGTLFLGSVLLFVFKNYVEFLVVAFLFDLLYGLPPGGESLFSVARYSFLLFTSALVLFFIARELRNTLSFYS